VVTRWSLKDGGADDAHLFAELFAFPGQANQKGWLPGILVGLGVLVQGADAADGPGECRVQCGSSAAITEAQSTKHTLKIPPNT
jgi:hypothetical protein